MRIKQKFYEFMHKVFVRVGRIFDFRCYNINLYWFHDEEYKKAWAKFPEANKDIHERRFNLYYLAKSVREIEGDLVECGVFRGAGSHLIMLANEGKNKKLHIFDSFEGLSEPKEIDKPDKTRTFVWNKHDLSASKDLVERNLSQFKAVHCYKGWIPERFADLESSKFSFVHIDVDLYQPTLDSIKFFYEKLSPGGLMLCDDYGFETCPGAKKAMDEFFSDKPESVIHLTTGQGFIIKQ